MLDYFGERQSGRTTAAVHGVLKTGGYLIVHSEDYRRLLEQHYGPKSRGRFVALSGLDKLRRQTNGTAPIIFDHLVVESHYRDVRERIAREGPEYWLRQQYDYEREIRRLQDALLMSTHSRGHADQDWRPGELIAEDYYTG